MKGTGNKIWLALLVCIVVIAAGCSSGSTKQEGGAATSTPAGQTGAPATSSAGGGKKTMTVAINGDIQNFNPYTNQSVDYFIVRYNVFDSLVRYDESMKVIPNLATWKQDNDTTLTFTLKDGIKFHNGAALTAEDVKYSIQTVQSKDTASYLASYFQDIASVETSGNNVTVRLSKPNPVMLSNFANFPIIQKDSLSAMNSKPVGTGPFKFVSWSAGDKIVLEKNADYWNGAKTNIDTLTVRPISDSAVRLNNLLSGTIDLVTTLEPNQMKQVEGKKGLTLLQPKSSNKTVLAEVALKNNKAFQDPRVMHALIYALDKESIKKNIYQGYGKILWSPFPSNNFGYKEGKAYPFNLDEAKKLLAEAGYSKGLSFTLILPSGFADLEQIAVMWQSNLKSVGVDMKIEKMELNSWVNKYVERSYEMTLNIYPQAGNDSSVYSSLILLPLAEKGMPNPAPVVDLINKGVSTTDEAARLKIYADIQDIVSEQAPIIPIQETPIAAGLADKISGVQLFPTSEIFLGNVVIK